MQLSVFVIAAVVTLAIPAVAMTVVAIVALRGTRPDERPEILRALAVLARANRGSISELAQRRRLPSSRAAENGGRERA
ncbi:hypothetical protein ACFYUV_24635 [Nonomuraea sp. NPDC003560]|uniref:hypothetical protein n=1 Tax=Nonomuraea sp. NPDC003560 TaxID=3364341 RepID=UPI0036A8E3CF